MANKMTINFKAVDDYLERLKKVDGAAERAVESALKQTQTLIADKAAAAMEPHNKSHITADQIIRDGVIEWTQQMASVSVGFQIEDNAGGMPGLPSIFIMHGTTLHGQPHTERDENLYNAVYGKETKKEVRALQKAAFDKALKEAGLVD